MWLITNFGFFSIVRKPEDVGKGTLTVRSRVQSDLEELGRRYLPNMGPILAHAGTDYPYRATVPQAEVAIAALKAVLDIDYANFKSSVSKRQGSSRSTLYHSVWSVLSDLEATANVQSGDKGARRGASTSPPPSREAPRSKGKPTTSTEAPRSKGKPTTSTEAPRSTEMPPSTKESAADSPSKRVSYGGVLIDGRGRVLLRKPRGEFDGYAWTFPKGVAEDGDDPEQTALREVREETGYEADVVDKIPGSHRGGTGDNEYFLMRPKGRQRAFDTHETEETKWVTVEEALAMIAQTRKAIGRKRDAAVLQAAVKLKEEQKRGK